jgi:hypothetical protein
MNGRDDVMTVSFDLQNVLFLPKSNVSYFSVSGNYQPYSKDCCAYNCILHEAIGG